MASSNRSSQPYWGQGNEDDSVRPLDPEQPVLNVAPISSVPYTGPPLSHSTESTYQTERTTVPVRNQPAMVFLPSHSTEEEWNRVTAATDHGVAITGVAALGMVGPPIGAIDISESKDTYHFRVSLPGVARDEKTFRCDVEPNGKIFIKGVTTTGEKQVHKCGMVFEMITRNLCPPGEFSISFQLPGPIDNQQLAAVFGTDGVFEGVVKKKAT